MRLSLPLLVLAAVLVSPSGLAARQDAPRSPRNASYTLTATLDPINRIILGRGRLTWRNTTSHPATELRFHMYWNAWRDGSTSWMREQALGLSPGFADRPSDDFALIDLTALSLALPAGSQDLLPQAHYIAPDDRNADDRTVLAVPLARPVAPGETIDVDLSWNAHVPRPFAATGAIGNNFFVARWFPAIGVLEDNGWNCHQMHAATTSAAFADYGVYDVGLTVPSSWVIGATGRERSKTTNADGTTTRRFTEADVNDFAWTASPDFVDLAERVEAPGLPPVDVRLLLQPEHRDQAARHFAGIRAALTDYGTWFGPYPYGHLTVVDPVTVVNSSSQGASTGDASYPTLLTTGTQWFVPWKDQQPEGAAIRGVGRQFWSGIVGTNDVEHAWLSAGLNAFAAARVSAAAFPDRFVKVDRYFGGFVAWYNDDEPWSREIEGSGLNRFRLTPGWDTQVIPTWRTWPGAAAATTDRATLWLTTLERMLGWETTQKILATFFSRGAFHHPTPDDFSAVASEVSGQDLTWFFDAVERSTARFDYSVAEVTSQVVDNGSIDSTVVVRRVGDGVFPVDVRVTFKDRSSVTERWDGKDGWHAFRYRRGSPVVTVEVDPDRVLMLDVNYTNNSWTSGPRTAETSGKWAWRWMTWLENVMLTYAFFA